MPRISTRLDPFDLPTINVLINELLSPKAQSLLLASVAKTARNEAIAINRRALGRDPKYDTYVDGRIGAQLELVKPNGQIIFEFQLLLDVFGWIGQQLVERSPVGDPPIHYFQNHLFFADGIQVMPGEKVPLASRYEFVNAVPYSRKIERGLSPQAPDGVYHVVAVMAQKKFGNIAKVRFTYRSIAGGDKSTRQPAILIFIPERRR